MVLVQPMRSLPVVAVTLKTIPTVAPAARRAGAAGLPEATTRSPGVVKIDDATYFEEFTTIVPVP
jgi:hypothetical protein